MNKTITHRLTELQTDKTISLTLSATKIITETGKSGKTKSTEKEFSSNNEAAKQFVKKEWEMLKKGFVLQNGNPAKGEPFLHYFVGTGYTGALSFQDTPDGIFIYKHGWFKEPDDQKDFLVLIDQQGHLKQTLELPKILAWDIQYNAATNALLLDLDHSIFEYKLAEQSFSSLVDEPSKWTSFISVQNTKIAYATHETVFVADNQHQLLFKQPYTVETINGTTAFCAIVSKNGAVLALHTSVGKIQLFDTVAGKLLGEITGDFDMIDQMEFADNDQLLVVKENYGSRSVRYFSLLTNTEIKFDTLQFVGYSKEVQAFCFNDDQSKLVLVNRTTACVYNFISKKYLFSFTIDHAVKTVQPKFVGEKLGIRTDYGCFSLYNV